MVMPHSLTRFSSITKAFLLKIKNEMAKESNKYLYTHKRFTVIEKCNEVLLTEYSELIKRTPLETFFVPLPKKKKKKHG